MNTRLLKNGLKLQLKSRDEQVDYLLILDQNSDLGVYQNRFEVPDSMDFDRLCEGAIDVTPLKNSK
ncbi:hypothetical protein BpHYR1_043192, partial [Brachionus plicatilis]